MRGANLFKRASAPIIESAWDAFRKLTLLGPSPGEDRIVLTSKNRRGAQKRHVIIMTTLNIWMNLLARAGCPPELKCV